MESTKKREPLNRDKMLQKYALAWSDEFDNEGRPDETKWSCQVGNHQWANQELQAYTDHEENIYVKDGRLHICARKERDGEREYTSARLTTYGKRSFCHGFFEFRAKLPKGAGSWPAVWMLADAAHEGGRWPDCGEIDFMEHVGKWESRLLFSLHSKNHNHTRKDTVQYTTFMEVPGVCEEFHDYAMEWTPDYFEFFVDGNSMCRYCKSDDEKDQSVQSWPFDQKFCLMVNIAVGGGLGGPVDESTLPYLLEVEYIRVYE